MKEQCIKNMFDKDDYIILKNKKVVKSKKEPGKDIVTFTGFNTKPSTAIAIDDFSFICANAIDIESDDRATNDNIITYRNFVIENDQLNTDEQLQAIKRSGLPVSHQVWSGRNSIHNIISLEEPLANQDVYEAWFIAIAKGLAKFDYKADPACKNPSRLTRMPEGTSEKTGEKQAVKWVGTRVKQEALLEWFRSMGVQWEDYLPKYNEWTQVDGPDNADDTRRWEVTKKFAKADIEEYRNLGDGEREPYRFRIILKAKECGLSIGTTLGYMRNEFPSSEGDKKLEAQVERVWKREVKRINIASKDEWVKLQEDGIKNNYQEDFAKLLDDEYNLKNVSSGRKRDEDIPEDFETQLYRYIRVGNDIYLIANRKLYKRSLQSFTIHHRKQDLRHINTYVDFCTEPGYFNFKPVVNQYYNDFQLPDWNATEGNCDFTINFLKHIGQENFEVLLDYLQILLTNPKATLPILALISYEKGTAKSTFIKFLTLLFQSNVAEQDPKEFVKQSWNTSWCNKHIITLDEVEKLGDLMDEFASKLKRQVYRDTIVRYKKSHDDESIPFIGKFVLASNQEGGFVDITPDEDRYLLLKVPKYKGEFDPNYVDKLENEIPYFVYYMMHREMKWKKPQGRSWFPISVLHNDAFKAIAENSRPEIEIDVDLKLTEWFESNPNEEEMYFLISDFESELGNFKYNQKDVKSTLHKLYGVTAGPKRTQRNAYKNFAKQQRQWIKITRNQVMTNEDFNDDIAKRFENLL